MSEEILRRSLIDSIMQRIDILKDSKEYVMMTGFGIELPYFWCTSEGKFMSKNPPEGYKEVSLKEFYETDYHS